jgi:hypothetical protein
MYKDFTAQQPYLFRRTIFFFIIEFIFHGLNVLQLSKQAFQLTFNLTIISTTLSTLEEKEHKSVLTFSLSRAVSVFPLDAMVSLSALSLSVWYMVVYIEDNYNAKKYKSF